MNRMNKAVQETLKWLCWASAYYHTPFPATVDAKMSDFDKGIYRGRAEGLHIAAKALERFVTLGKS